MNLFMLKIVSFFRPLLSWLNTVWQFWLRKSISLGKYSVLVFLFTDSTPKFDLLILLSPKDTLCFDVIYFIQKRDGEFDFEFFFHLSSNNERLWNRIRMHPSFLPQFFLCYDHHIAYSFGCTIFFLSAPFRVSISLFRLKFRLSTDTLCKRADRKIFPNSYRICDPCCAFGEKLVKMQNRCNNWMPNSGMMWEKGETIQPVKMVLFLCRNWNDILTTNR